MKSGSLLFIILIFPILSTVLIADTRTDVQLEGKWTGKWVSEARGQSGPLNATFSINSEGKYQAIFEGRFFKVFPFRFVVPLETKSVEKETITLTGKMNAGELFGVFEYVISASNGGIEVKYTSQRDHGVFQVTRPTVVSKEKKKRSRRPKRNEKRG